MKNIYCFLLVLATLKIYSQDISVVKNQFKIDILLPGFVYEHGFTSKNTLYSELSFGVGYRNNYYNGSSLKIYPTINEQFRYYYNLENRAYKGKRTRHNSGNFIAMNAIYYFKPISNDSNDYISETSLTIAPIWGLQRTYKGNFNLGFNAGFGYNIVYNDSHFTPVANFTLGWIIGK